MRDVPPTLEDVPEWARKELQAAEAEHRKKLFDAMIHVAALAQQQIQPRRLIFDLKGNGDVVISSVFDREGDSAVPYAHVSRDGKIRITGSIASPPEEHPGSQAAQSSDDDRG